MSNKADDVLKYRKWRWEQPQVGMCRPGCTNELHQALVNAKVNLTSGIFIVGPELEDISSTHVRDVLIRGDRQQLLRMLHPDVANWCWDHGPYRPTSREPTSREPWGNPRDADVRGVPPSKKPRMDNTHDADVGDVPSLRAPRIRVVRRTDGNGVVETLLRSVATPERCDAVWIEGRPSVRDGCFVEELLQDSGFSWVRTFEHFSKLPPVEGFVNSSYLHDDCPATIMRSDGTRTTLLRKIATHQRCDSVWVYSRKVVRNGEIVQMMSCQGDFTWVQTSDGIEGFLKTEYLKAQPYWHKRRQNKPPWCGGQHDMHF